jgi:hypothetical protein
MGCNSTSKEKNLKGDTTLVYVLYIKDYSGNLWGVISKRVVKDVNSEVAIDDETSKKIWHKDTTYLIGVSDTLRDKSNKPLIDSATKKVKMGLFFNKLDLPSKYVWPTAIVIQ